MRRRTSILIAMFALLGTLLGALPASLPARHRPAVFLEAAYSADVPRIVIVKSAVIPTREGLRLRLTSELGDVFVMTDGSSEISYHMALQADARDLAAQKLLQELSVAARESAAGIELSAKGPWRALRGRVWVGWEIHVPSRYSLEIATQAGNISVRDIDGNLALSTGGGNIAVRRVGPPAGRDSGGVAHPLDVRLLTQGGHITTGYVAGNLRAVTAGGFIRTGNIARDAHLESGGGHIRSGEIGGAASVKTAGGNIEVASARAGISAKTGGGQIDFGEAAGNIRVQADGGAVQIGRVSGPASIESGGDVMIRQVDGPLRVSAATGDITAWFGAAFHAAAGPDGTPSRSRLATDGGDITVYLPRELPMALDAQVERGQAYRVATDPALPLRLSYHDAAPGSPATLRARSGVDGAGEILDLRAVSGNILVKADPAGAADTAQQRLDPFAPGGFFEEIRRKILSSWWGAVPLDADQLQPYQIHSVYPRYPEVARRAGMEGDVVVRAQVSPDGRMMDLKVISGKPLLAQAALEAMRGWRYQPVVIDGRAVPVVTTLTIAFRLQ